MAAEKFAELVRRLHPDVSVRQLEMRAGLPKGAIGYYLKPSSQIAHMPKATVITRLAQALGCHPTEVSKAFAGGLNIVWTQQLSADEEALLQVMRSLTPAGQETLLHLGKALMNIHGSPSCQPSRLIHHSGSVPD